MNPHLHRRSQPTHRLGLSLLEVVLALAILAVSVAMLSQITRQATDDGLMAKRLATAQILCESKMSEVLADIKRPVAQRAIAYLVSRRSSFLNRLTVRNAKRTYRRFWQAGPGQDHNIYDPDTAHRVVEYIHCNPLRRGLVSRAEDWCWSSSSDWNGRLDVPIRIDRTLPAVVEIPSG